MVDLSSEKAQSFYYSAHHLARDLFWNAGTFAFFVCLGAILDERLRGALSHFLTYVAGLSSAALQIAIALSCLAVGAVAGIITTHIYWGVTEGSAESRSRTFTFEGRYRRDRAVLRQMYENVFSGHMDLLRHHDFREMDMIVRMTSLMRLHNPSGYVHVFRTYSLVALINQAIVYSIALLANGLWIKTPVAVLVPAGLLLALIPGLRYALTYSICREFAFLVSSFHWLEHQRAQLQGARSPGEANATPTGDQPGAAS